MYDSLHLHTLYSAADNIPRAQFPKPYALLEQHLQFFFCFFFAVFAELFLASRFCRVIFSWPLQKDKFVLYFFFALQCFEHARSVWDC